MSFNELHPNVKIRIIVDFTQKIVNNMIIPFMAIYLTNAFGLKLSGIMIAVAILIGIISSFYGGYYSDVVGRKKVLVIAEFVNIIIFGCMALFNSPWITSQLITYFMYIAHNIVVYSATPAADAMIIDVSAPAERKFIYSIKYWVVNMSFGIGALIGAFFYKNFFFEVLIASSAITTIIFLTYLIFIEETIPQKDNSNQKVNIINMFSSYKAVMKDNIFLLFVIASLFLMSIELQLANYISVRLSNEFKTQEILNLVEVTGVEMYGILRAENTFAVVFLALIINKLFKKMENTSRLLIGSIVFTIGYMVVAVSNSAIVLILVTLIFTIGEMMYVPIKQTILSLIIKEELRSQYMAVYSLHFRFALLIASISISIGAIISSIGMAILYGVLGILSAFLFYKVTTVAKVEVTNEENSLGGN